MVEEHRLPALGTRCFPCCHGIALARSARTERPDDQTARLLARERLAPFSMNKRRFLKKSNPTSTSVHPEGIDFFFCIWSMGPEMQCQQEKINFNCHRTIDQNDVRGNHLLLTPRAKKTCTKCHHAARRKPSTSASANCARRVLFPRNAGDIRGHRESARGQFHDFDEFVGPFLKSLELFDVQSLIKIYHSLIQLCSDLGVSQHIL